MEQSCPKMKGRIVHENIHPKIQNVSKIIIDIQTFWWCYVLGWMCRILGDTDRNFQ